MLKCWMYSIKGELINRSLRSVMYIYIMINMIYVPLLVNFRHHCKRDVEIQLTGDTNKQPIIYYYDINIIN